MSDGLDPRHGPYKGDRGPQLEEWCHEFMWNLVKLGALRGDVSVKKATDEIKTFATQVVRATRDGCFLEVT